MITTQRDIFGKSPSDYPGYAKLQKEGLLEKHLELQSREKMLPPHNFSNDWVQKADLTAQSSRFVTDNLMAVQENIDKVYYRGARFEGLFPIVTNVDPGAEEYSYPVVDMTGEATLIASRHAAPQVARTNMYNNPSRIFYYGLVAEWSQQEVRAAMFQGRSITTLTIEAATTGVMNAFDRTALTGVEQYGIKGITNYESAAAPVGDQVKITPSPKTFTAATADEITTYLQTWISALSAESNEVIGNILGGELIVALPPTQFNKATTARLQNSPNYDTIGSFVSLNNSWVARSPGMNSVRFVSLLELAAANNNDFNQDRAALWVNNPLVCEIAVPLAPNALPAQESNYDVRVPIDGRISQLNIKRVGGIKYFSNV